MAVPLAISLAGAMLSKRRRGCQSVMKGVDGGGQAYRWGIGEKDSNAA